MVIALEYFGAPGRVVEVLGDLPSWKLPRRMQEVSPGEYRLLLELPPGIYRYKFRVDGTEWVADPRAKSVDPVEGFGNSELFVEASRPPLFFAPDRKHVGRAPRLEIYFETTATPPSAVETVLEIGGRALCRVTLEGAPGTLIIDGQSFPLPAHALQPWSRPPWLRGAVLYSIFVDRWIGNQELRSTGTTFYGGKLASITASLDYLADLGATALLLTPIARANSPHRYDPLDLQQIDPALGGEQAFASLIEAAHARSLRIIVDAPMTHVGEDHPAFLDLLKNQERSPYASWFHVRRFPVVKRDPDTYAHYYSRPELPWLNLSSPGARAHAIASVQNYIRLGADGVRLDAMDEAPDDFWIELRKKCPDILLLGEVVIDNLAHYAEERGADVITDFRHRDTMLRFFARGELDAAGFWTRSLIEEHRTGPVDAELRLLFLDNHDTPRFRSLAITHDRLRLALTYLYLRPEPIQITYGTEAGMAGGAHAGDREGVWCERLPMPEPSSIRTETLALMKSLARVRRLLAREDAGRLAKVHTERKLLVLRRGRVWAAINAGTDRETIPTPPSHARTLISVNGCSDEPAAPLPAFTARLLLVAD